MNQWGKASKQTNVTQDMLRQRYERPGEGRDGDKLLALKLTLTFKMPLPPGFSSVPSDRPFFIPTPTQLPYSGILRVLPWSYPILYRSLWNYHVPFSSHQLSFYTPIIPKFRCLVQTSRKLQTCISNCLLDLHLNPNRLFKS